MADAVAEQMERYRSSPFDSSGEAWDKIAALESLEAQLNDPRVIDFFVAVIGDPAEYDMARVHLLKLLEICPAPEFRQRIGECVAAVLPGEPDWTVRCWLGRAVAAYSDIPAARTAAARRCARRQRWLIATYRGCSSACTG